MYIIFAITLKKNTKYTIYRIQKTNKIGNSSSNKNVNPTIEIVVHTNGNVIAKIHFGIFFIPLTHLKNQQLCFNFFDSKKPSLSKYGNGSWRSNEK